MKWKYTCEIIKIYRNGNFEKISRKINEKWQFSTRFCFIFVNKSIRSQRLLINKKDKSYFWLKIRKIVFYRKVKQKNVSDRVTSYHLLHNLTQPITWDNNCQSENRGLSLGFNVSCYVRETKITKLYKPWLLPSKSISSEQGSNRPRITQSTQKVVRQTKEDEVFDSQFR